MILDLFVSIPFYHTFFCLSNLGRRQVIADSNNSRNRKSRNKNNKSGYRNVCWDKRENVWLVQLQIDGKCKRVGKFPKDQLEEAGKFAEEMRKKYYGEFAGSN